MADPKTRLTSGRTLRALRSGLPPSQNAVRARALQRARPSTQVPDTQRVDYETYQWLSRATTGNPLSRQDFQNLAGSREAQQYDQRARDLQGQRRQEEQSYNALLQEGAQQNQQVQAQGAFQERVASAQDALQRIGQHQETTAEDFRNIAEMSATLLSLEGEDEASAEARTFAAQVLSEHGARLAPHLDTLIEPGWLSSNSGRIDQILEDAEPSGFGKVRDIAGRALDATLNFSAVRIPLETLQQAEQAWFRVGFDLSKAVDPTVSNEDRLDYLQDLGSTAARGAGSIVSGGGNVPGIREWALDPTGAITVGDEQIFLDADQSGDANLREVMGLDPEAGGFGGDAADLLGTILLDPTTYLTLGAKPTGRLVTSALSQSQDSIARKAAVQMRNGARLGQLDDVTQEVVRRELLRYQWEAVSAPRNRNLVLQNLRRHPTDVLRGLRKEIDNSDKLIENLVNDRTARMTKAAERGIYPAVRIAGRQVIPMRKLYNALGIIDTRLADNSAWAQQALQLADIEDTDELLRFIQVFDGGDMPEHVREQVHKWSALSTRMADDPETWLDDLLQRSATGAEAETFDQIEAFGRTLLGDDSVSEWRRWFEDNWARDIRPTTTTDGPGIALAKDVPINRAIDELDPASLSDEARARLAYNMEIFNEPMVWLPEINLVPRGLRRVAQRDTIIGNLLRRVSDDLSPRAGIRRTGDLGEMAADRVEDLTAVQRAKRQMVTDHVNRLGVDRSGRSRLYDQASDELDEDVSEYLNRVLSQSPDDIAAEVQRLADEGSVATSQLLNTVNDIRDDIFDLSVAAGADEAALLGMKGYLPRSFTEEARERADRAAMPGSATAHEVPGFQRVGLLSDDNVIAPGNPLAQAGSLRGRTFERDIQDLYEVNKAARRELADAGLDGLDGFRLYEDDPIRAILLRSREAHEAYAWMDMVKGMSDVSDLNGRPLAYVAGTEDEIADVAVRMSSHDATFGKANYDPRDLPNGGRYWVRKEISDEIERVNDVIRNPAMMSRFRRTMTRWNDVWGAWATVPLVGGFGFHARNAVGNSFNMILAGANNPLVLADANSLQRVNRRAVQVMRSEGIDFTDALRQVGADDGTIALLRDARKYGVISGGQTADVFTATDQLAGRAGGRGSLNPTDQSNFFLRTGRSLGEAIENNARLGLFIDGKVHKGMNSSDAAARVRKYLFDYGDLTQFESQNMRMLARFYTFARKNTALQARMLITQPGRVHNAQRIADELTNQIMGVFGYESEGAAEPGTSLSGERIPDWVPPTLGLYRNEDGEAVIAGLDSPLVAASETIDGLAALLKLPPSFLLKLSAGSEYEAEQREEGFQDKLGQALGMLSGGPVEGVKTSFEFATGRDLFTGGSLKDVDRNWVDTMARLADVLIPAFSKIDREAEYNGIYRRLGVLQDEDRPDRAGELRLLNTLLGITVREGISDPDQITRNMNALSYDLSRGLQEAEIQLEEDGITVPTFDEFLEAGGYYNRDEAMEMLIYDTLEDALTPEERERLQRMIPKNVRDAAGVDVPERQRAEWDALERARRVREIMTALESEGIEVTQEMIDGLLLRESGARISDVKGLGIEPAFQANGWMTAGDPEEANRVRQQQSVDQLEALARLFGVSIMELQERYPLLQPAERTASQMAEAGFTDSEIAAELMDGLSRQEQALIFGEGILEDQFSYEALTADELLDFQHKAARADAELRVIMQVTLGRQPTQAELDEWLSEVMLMGPEQEALGFENYSPPRRDNTTSDSVYDERLRQKLDVLTGETDFLSP